MAKRSSSLFPLKGLMAGRRSFLSRDALSAHDRSSCAHTADDIIDHFWALVSEADWSDAVLPVCPQN